jgi:ABC-type nitrate/sulfonate/bicarbonate transport system permease component
MGSQLGEAGALLSNGQYCLSLEGVLSFTVSGGLLFLLLREIVLRIGLADPTFLPPFVKVILASFNMIRIGEFFTSFL